VRASRSVGRWAVRVRRRALRSSTAAAPRTLAPAAGPRAAGGQGGAWDRVRRWIRIRADVSVGMKISPFFPLKESFFLKKFTVGEKSNRLFAPLGGGVIETRGNAVMVTLRNISIFC